MQNALLQNQEKVKNTQFKRKTFLGNAAMCLLSREKRWQINYSRRKLN